MSSISSINAVHANYHSEAYQRVQNWKSLGNALEAGDLSAAQTAFSALEASKSQKPQTSQSVQESQNTQGNTIKDDMQALSDALQSGDITTAQTAFAKLQEDLKNLRTDLLEKRHHHGHHHHHDSTDDSNTTTTDGTSILNANSEQSTPGSNFSAVA